MPSHVCKNLHCLYNFYLDTSTAITVPPSTKRRKIEKVPWTNQEKKVVLEAFHKHVVGKTLPGKEECKELIERNNCLSDRSWTKVKDFVRNYKLRANDITD